MSLFCASAINKKNGFAQKCALFSFFPGACVKCQEIVVLNFATFWEEILPLVDYRCARSQAGRPDILFKI
jgi:hypothetical protein